MITPMEADIPVVQPGNASKSLWEELELFDPPTPGEQSFRLSCDDQLVATDAEFSQQPLSPTEANVTTDNVEPDSSPDIRNPPQHLSEFPSNCKRRWTLPECNPDEHTLLIAASNGVTLAKSAPRGWRVTAYRGARFVDIHRVLSSASLPEHIKTVVISVGLNDRFGNANAIREHVHELKLRLQANTHRYRVFIVPLLNFAPDPINNELLPRQFSEGQACINQVFYDLFQADRWLIPLPMDLYAVKKFPHSGDWSHYNVQTARLLMTHIVRYIQKNR